MQFEVRTTQREQMVDITAQVGEAIASAVGPGAPPEGVVLVFCPHTTAAITINENADRDVVEDLLEGLRRIAPRTGGWRHAEGNSDGHLKASLVGASEVVPLAGGRMRLGTWQGIYLCEFDGPRTRRVEVTLLDGSGQQSV